jgi:cyclase
MLAAFDTLIAAAGPSTKVLPGHGPITNRAGIVSHKRMAIALRDQVAKMIAEGKTQEQVVAAKITNAYEKQTGNAAGTGDRFVNQLYLELKASS